MVIDEKHDKNQIEIEALFKFFKFFLILLRFYFLIFTGLFQKFKPCMAKFRFFAQGAALVLECAWIKGLVRLFLQLVQLVLPINT